MTGRGDQIPALPTDIDCPPGALEIIFWRNVQSAGPGQRIVSPFYESGARRFASRPRQRQKQVLQLKPLGLVDALDECRRYSVRGASVKARRPEHISLQQPGEPVPQTLLPVVRQATQNVSTEFLRFVRNVQAADGACDQRPRFHVRQACMKSDPGIVRASSFLDVFRDFPESSRSV